MRWLKPGDKVKCIKETGRHTVGKIYIVKKYRVSLYKIPNLPENAP